MSNPPPIPPPVSAGTAGNAVAPLPRPPRRRLWPMILLACVVFVGGTGFGAAVTVVVVLRRARMAMLHPELAPARLANELKRRLNLSEPQRNTVLAILTKRQQRLQAIRGQVQPQIETEMEGARDEISDTLNPDQRSKLNETFNEVKSRLLPPQQ